MSELNSIPTLLTDASLVSYWRFEGNSNDSKSTNNGTDTAMSYTGGKYGLSGNFNGTTSFISVADNAALSPASMTLSVWVFFKALPTSGNIQGIVDKRDNVSGTAGWLLQMFNNGTSMLVAWQGTGTSGNWQYTPTLNTWHHMCVTHTGTTIKLYIDSVYQGASGSFTITNFASPMLIGKRSDGGFFTGLIDDLAIFSRVLTAQEVLLLGKDRIAFNNAGLRPHPFSPGLAR